MAGRAEARTAVVAGADRRLAEAATPCRPRHADIARNDLSKSLGRDPRRAEEAADGASADGAQMRQAKGGNTKRDWDRSSILSPSANGRPRLRTAPCQVTGKEIFSPGRTTRTSRRSSSAIPAFVMLLKIPSRDTATVVGALTKHVRKLPQQLRRSLTWDRGKEMADHKSFTVATNVQVYFCDPHSPWQRGSNENTNGLLRQYFPRGTDLSCFSQDYPNGIARRLNQRPRKTLGFETPADRLQAVLH